MTAGYLPFPRGRADSVDDGSSRWRRCRRRCCWDPAAWAGCRAARRAAGVGRRQRTASGAPRGRAEQLGAVEAVRGASTGARAHRAIGGARPAPGGLRGLVPAVDFEGQLRRAQSVRPPAADQPQQPQAQAAGGLVTAKATRFSFISNPIQRNRSTQKRVDVN